MNSFWQWVFRPRSLALVGASTEADSGTNAIFLLPLREYGFPGPIYPINPKAEEIMGLKAYPSLEAVPGPVDYVIYALAASHLPPVLDQCLAKGVKVLHVFSAGFSELGTEEGRKLEREVIAKARLGGMRVIGPNCFGISYPASGLCSMPDMGKEPGRVSVISQSAATARDLTEGGAQRGVRFSKVINYGNGADLSETDFLGFLGQDPETELIAGYLEGAKDPRFFPVLKLIASQKPVLLLKGGRSQAGSRAAQSHSGALATPSQLWNGLMRQAGAIPAQDLEELEDLMVVFTLLRQVQGRRVAIVIFGGGFCVQAADDCERAGLRVPPLDGETRSRLSEFISPIGTCLRNPIDVPPNIIWNVGNYFQALAILADSPEVDLIITRFFIPASTYRDHPRVFHSQLEGVLRARRELGKPVAVVNRFTGASQSAEMGVRLTRECAREGVAVLPSFSRAARALGQFLDYQERERPWPSP